MICAVNLTVLGLKAYWYTGSAFTRYLQSYIHLPSLVSSQVLLFADDVKLYCPIVNQQSYGTRYFIAWDNNRF